MAIEAVKAWRTADGKVFESAIAADKHEAYNELLDIFHSCMEDGQLQPVDVFRILAENPKTVGRFMRTEDKK